MQPVLRPGVRVLRRDARTLQVGLDPGTRVLLPDTSTTRRLEAADPLREDPDLCADLSRLVLPDDAALRAALPATGQGYDEPATWSRHALASLAAAPGPVDPARRRRGHVLVHTPGELTRRVAAPGGSLSRALADDLRLLCRRSGVHVGPRPPRDVVTVRVLVCVGEPDRSRVDRWVERGTPHLLVRFAEGSGTVGPFVVPGRTPCLRCTDTVLATHDPAWPLLVEQLGRLDGADRADGVPEPLDPALAWICLAWAARDLTAYVDGREPLTLARTLRIDERLTEVACQDWPPADPDCTCQR